MFDPEKVEHFDYDDVHGYTHGQSGEFVNASDYDALLALYREVAKHVVCGLCGASIWLVSVHPEPEWSHYGNAEDGSTDHGAVSS